MPSPEAIEHGVGTVRRLECCCCGEDAGRFAQWWNRDKGYGMCRRCVDSQIARGTPADEIQDLYGVEGINYAKAKA